MKLHHLRLTAIGPFAGTVDVDFAALGASGMFLLEGPTGSGKSTILDAIVYALYGQVAGSATSTDRIRSQFAGPTEPSVVDLVFETGAGIFRVRRSPEFQRPKQRGTGTTKEQAKAVLWRIGSPELIPAVVADSAGAGAGLEVVATRMDEVGREIQRAVGLSREQFTQTVLLPQNEFARFLRAGTAERQQVLQRVFGTELYEQVEKRLAEMRVDANKQVTAARETLGRALARFVEATGVEGEQEAALTGQAQALRPEALAEGADAALAGVTTRAQEATTRAAATQQAEQAARTAAEAAALAARRIDRRRELQSLAARLEEQEPAVDGARTALSRDEAARPVVAALGRREEARARAAGAIESLADLASRTGEERPDLLALLPDGAAGTDGAAGADGTADGSRAAEADAALAAAVQESTTAAGALADLVALETGLPAREKALDEERERVAATRTALASATALLETRPAAREELVTARDEARTRAADLADARLAQSAATEQATAARAAQQQAAAIQAALETRKAALATASAAAEAEAELRRRRYAGIAAELAVALEDGDPCPVCGALEHPHRADPAEDAVSPEQVEAAEAARVEAEAARSRAEQAHALAEEKLARLREAAGGLEPDAARAAVETATTRVEVAQAGQETAARLEQRITAHDAETEQLTRRGQADALALSRAETALEAAATAIGTDRERIAEARGEDGSVGHRRRAHLARAAAATTLRDALRARTEAEERAREAEEEVARTLAAAAIATDEQARAAVLEPAERKRFATLLEARAVDEARLADGLAEEGVAGAPTTDAALEEARAAVTATAQALTAAQAAAREDGAAAARLEAVAERGRTARAALDRAIDEVRSVSERAGVIVRVADLATGRSADGERVQLSTYVLKWRLDAVVEAANARLALFSGSELELLRDTGARGARKTGLDLLVMDRRTDQVRVPETLSGGETFFVSLALALGLADIVMGEAGGVQMETLVIDEGFGSLDPETLETVVREIGRLAEGGRTIGIVSHVGDMKAQIAEQIHVRRGEGSRSTLTITA
ncbi:SMC family ATPase [Brachybacterium sp. NBEC-018]|uniref:AAA family ATPase n=1 Tax=Brachybacterium sp. NBEC-018 TaxID=2996004 RepID=UPI0021752A5E|nr:SMC family ATPase [Brachybacterium sp. NBEC-018]UVY85124.1 SMC family ATPase [Brachybacterium sp. NBEC-018]